MADTLHIVIHQEPPGRTGGRSTTASRGLRDPEHETTLPNPDDPEHETTLPNPDDPEHETTLPNPDDPEHETTLPNPDDPRGRWATVALQGGAPWLSGSAAAAGYGCVPVCGCHGGEERLARPEMLPRDYSGFVILRLAAGVEIGGLEHLWDIAAENGLTGLTAVLELEKEWRENGDGAGGEADEDESAGEVGTAGATAAAGSRLGFFGRSKRQEGSEHGGHRVPGGPGDRYTDVAPGSGGDGGETDNGETDSDGTGGKGGNADEEITDVPPGGPLPPGLRSWPLIAAHGRLGRGELVEAVRGLEARAARTPLAPRHSLTRYWRIDLRPYPERAAEVVEKLRPLAEVDLAYRELAASDPQYASPPAGESLAEGQGYLDEAPAGIGARWAWEQIGRRRQHGPASIDQVKVCDLEQRWEPLHQDLPPLELHYGENRDAAGEEAGGGHHGTAVLGQLAAANEAGTGVAGGAQPVGSFSLSSHYRSKRAPVHTVPGTNGHVAAAIVFTLLDGGDGEQLDRGDVLLLEVQRAGLPTEVDAADFDAVRLAAALGVVVVEAAGNGGRDLDAYVDPDTGYELRRGAAGFRDSGAILVGAARSALPHDRASFSNHGSRVDCFAWGDSVTSCGYGDLSGAKSTDYYTNTFSGTSSAAPIITAAAALVQALHPGRLDSRQMRALLSNPATGTRQGPNVAGHVGVMPDLRRLVCDELQLVPDVYLRRWTGDDGRRPRRDDPVASSPDVMALPAGREAGSWRGTRAHHPAPGGRAEPGGDYEVWTRLRNRGTGEGEVTVRVFHSPAATLIPPELWHPVAQGSSLWVEQGDVPFEPDALPFKPPAVNLGGWGPPPYSFLAVARPVAPAPAQGQPAAFPAPVDRSGGLPPGGEWFDWAEYRAFLRRSGVAWRNVYTVGPAAMQAMPFFLAGTPDRERRFTFEVIRRLPAGASVSLSVPAALAARLVQAQPLLTGSGTALELPARPLLAVPGVALPAGLRARATFAVRLDDPSPPSEGYSLALRQLWRGEEVGRITWYLRKPRAAGDAAPEDEGRSTA
jgi:hypothetical protein